MCVCVCFTRLCWFTVLFGLCWTFMRDDEAGGRGMGGGGEEQEAVPCRGGCDIIRQGGSRALVLLWACLRWPSTVEWPHFFIYFLLHVLNAQGLSRGVNLCLVVHVDCFDRWLYAMALWWHPACLWSVERFQSFNRLMKDHARVEKRQPSLTLLFKLESSRKTVSSAQECIGLNFWRNPGLLVDLFFQRFSGKQPENQIVPPRFRLVDI